MADIYKFAESWMRAWVRKGPGISNAEVRVEYASNNKEYRVLERKNLWLKIGENQWICEKDTNGLVIFKKIRSESIETPQSQLTPTAEVENNTTNNSNMLTGDDIFYLERRSSVENDFTTSLENNFKISNLRGIFGMPYQFMPNADPRIDGSSKDDSIGRKYANEIVSKMPLLLITPGKPKFMGEYDRDTKKVVLGDFLNNAFSKSDKSNIDDLINNENFGKYYTLEYAYNDYYNYVNPMCRIAARLLNLEDISIDGTTNKLGSYYWSKNTNENFSKLFSVYRGCTAWYCDSDTSISESFSNSTTESMLASKINSLSEYGRELQFLLGTAKTTTGVELDKFTSIDNLDSNIGATNDFIDRILGSNSSVGGIFKSLTNSVQTVIAGGKLVFPQIWAESSANRTYSVKLKLVSPDADNLSVYLNIIVPMLHLIALVLPREAEKSHGYISPFLVRAFYKGLFNVDMGIITNLSFTKGKEAAWSNSGIPTVVEVDMDIQDLYNDMYITSMTGMRYNMMNNIILMDYISNLCGININEPDIIRAIDLYWTQNIKNRVTDIWHMNIWGNLDQFITNKYQDIFGKF